MTIKDLARSWRRHLEFLGLTVIDGEIVAAEVDIALIASAVLSVANASQHVAQEEIAKATYAAEGDFRNTLRDYLERKFMKRARHDVELVGGSNKKHVFAHVIEKVHGGLLVVDPVLPETNSINSRIVAHVDLRNLKEPKNTQRLIYDDKQSWNASDLQMLLIGAPVLAFSAVDNKLPQLAEAA